MKWTTKTWFLLSLILFLSSAYFWHLGNKYQSSTSAPALTNVPPAVLSTNISAKFGNRLLTPGAINLNPVASTTNQAGAAARGLTNGYRLSNSSKRIEQLARSDAAILLRNAFIETTSQTPLEIPEHLHSKTAPGSYIVQSRELLDDNFRALLKAAGATIISYIPNNAYLVRVDAPGANQLAGHPRTQAILPYEPYYKLDERLLFLAIEQKMLPEGARLNLTLFPGERSATLDAIEALGVELLGEDRSPFGPQMIVQAKPDSLVALAQLTGVQAIETYAPRVFLNDRTRVRLGVTTDTTSTTNDYLGLTGEGVLVNVNDTGVDATHPGLAGRVTSANANALTDADGHGTHVAGTIAGSGAQSSTVANASGSVTNANFRGMAPAARLFVLPVDLTFGPLISDSYLQETAARTNPTLDKPLISNNGWGYQGVVGYNSSAASYDAAVRDALPGSTGSQPMIYVFAAGDSGFGFDTGEGGLPGTVIAPATAKNVISVGAIESARGLTNEIVVTNIVTDDLGMTVTNVSTNQLFFGATDSDIQVTSFSSRGNIAPGLEGPFGRFKPDVVAPGSFIISARSKDWTDPTAFEDVQLSTLSDQVVAAGSSKTDLIFVPENARELLIRLVPNANSASTFPLLPILVKRGSAPTTNAFDASGTNQVIIPSGNVSLNPGFWFFQVLNPGSQTAFYDLQTVLTTTNGTPDYFAALKAENDALGPNYRYESGSSMSAAAVSGVLALMQEFFDRNNLTYSPALMKALLINGARSAGPLYSFQVGALVNQQGWGVVNVTNSIPAALQTGDNPASPVRYVDQSITNALATGETRSWKLSLSTEAQQFPLRITLVWTDPPGNPGAALKLVNDLDLVVENLDTGGQIFYGNNIPFGSDFTTPSATNSPPVNDFVNNVENVYLNGPVGSNYAITVSARRINVNAVPQHPSGIVQDFALVVSSDNSSLTNAVALTPTAPVPLPSPPATTVTNGVPLLHERVGANSPLLGGTNGTPSQWNFYVFTNDFSATNAVAVTNGTNVAFLTFLPPNVSRPRNLDADVDLYVSRGVPLTNLNLSGAVSKSTQRGGSELVFFTNSFDKEVFYVGIKSEDQQGGEYGLVGLSSALPFTEEMNGNLVVHGLPFNVQVADGTPDAPGGAMIFGIATRPVQVQRAVVNMSVTHESIGDLLGNLSHNGRFAVLNNHFLPSGPPPLNDRYSFTYDDSHQGDNLGQFTPGPSDGPGSLNDFIGEDGSGAWQLTMVDNTPSGIGRVESFDMVLVPSPDPNNILSSVVAQQFVYYFIDVPADATNLTAALSSITPSAPLELYLRLGDLPDFANYDKFAKINPPGGSLTITPGDIPPLNAGRYFVGVYNPNNFLVNFRLRLLIGRGVVSSAGGAFSSERAVAILDDAVSQSTITVPTDGIVSDVKVGVRIDHARLSDLALHLTSPQGSRVLLAENRGGITATNFGEGNSQTAITYAGFTENTNLAVGLMKFVSPPYATNITVKTNLVGGFEGIPARVYPPGQTVDGWDVLTNPVTVVTSVLAHSGTNVLDLGLGHISRAMPTTAGKQYDLKFAYRAKDPGTINVQVYLDGVLVRFLTGSSSEWKIASFTFVAPQEASTLEIRPLFSNPGMLLDTFTLVESGGAIYYQPEESLDILKGERSLGDWTLEMWDSRGQFAGTLLNWQLQLTFANPSKTAVTLTNGLCYPGTVANDDIAYFIVDVPRSATSATNTLTGTGDLILFFNQNGAPTGGPSDFVINANGPDQGEELLLSTNTIPLLQPGQRYYLGVQNATPGESNAFTICVNFDRIDENIILLTNAVAYTNTIQVTNRFDYYQFTVSLTAYQVNFDLIPQNGNVDLFVHKGFPLPTTNIFDYVSANLATNTENIVITNFSKPVGLSAGDWFLGVHNADSVPVSYSIVATELTNAFTLIRLTNGIPFDYSHGVSPPVTNFFLFTVGQTNAGVRFELFNLTGEADLLADINALPLPPGDRGLITAPAELLFRTNDVFPVLNGDWYVAVLNATATNINFTVRASLVDTNISATTLTNGVGVTNTTAWEQFRAFGQEPEIDYYKFAVSSNAVSAVFGVSPVDGNVDLVIGKDLAALTRTNFAFASTNRLRTNELITVTADSPLLAGDWYLGVYNLENKNSVTYSIRAAEFLSSSTNVYINPDITVTATNICLNWDSIIGRQYFVEGKSNIADLAWTVLSPTNTATTTNMSFCIPRPTDFRFFRVVEIGGSLPPPPSGTNTFINPTLTISPTNICLSWPAVVGRSYYVEGKTNLTVLDWTILSPTNVATSTNMSYCIDRPTDYAFFQVVELAEISPPPPGTNTFINPSLTLSPTNICLSWPAVVGRSYYVEGKTNLTVSDWTILSPTNVATSTNMSYCIDRPTDYAFFQVVELAEISPPPPGTNTFINPSLTLSPTNICLSWPAVVGRSYYVEGKTNLTVSDWTILSPTNVATSASMSYCIDRPTDYAFFQVVELAEISPPPSGTNTFINPSLTVSPTNICLSWPAVVGRSYYVEGKTNLTVSDWTILSPTNVATSASMSYCIDRPTDYAFFQVVELAEISPPPSGTNTFINPSLTVSPTNICLSWPAVVGRSYYVEGKTNLTVSDWTILSPTNVATSTSMSYCIDRPTDYAFFQVVELAEISPPPPGTNTFINPSLTVSPTNICLSWPAVVGRSYYVEGKTNLTVSDWTILSTTNVATSTSMSYCIDRPTDYAFFQVVELAEVSPPPPGTNTFINPSLTVSPTNICLSWPAVVGRSYYLEGKTNLTVSGWTILSPTNVATSTSMSYCIDRPTDYAFFQVVELAEVSPPPPSTNTFINPSLTLSSTNICLSWTAIVGRSYYLEGKTNLTVLDWTILSTTNVATSTDSTLCIEQPTPYQFFQVVQVGALSTNPPPLSTNLFITPVLAISSSNICLFWDALVDTNYYVQGKTNIGDAAWVTLSPTNSATSTNMSYCVPFPTDYRFFQVVQSIGDVPTPPATLSIDFTSLILSTNRFSFQWTAPSTQRFQVQYATNLPPPWITLTNIVGSTNGNFIFLDGGFPSNNPPAVRYYRLLLVP